MTSRKNSIRILLGFLFFISIFSALYLFADTNSTRIRNVLGIGGIEHLTGTFYTDNGNPGIIEFERVPTNSGSYSGARLISDLNGNTLSGYFWIGTIGWVSFENVDFYPSGGAPTDPYTLSGWIWSDYAGWIDLSETGNVIWDPNNTFFSGFAWNEGIGWIDFDGASLENTSSGLIGKVKILGNLGSSQLVDTTYSIKASSVPGITMNTLINTIRKNVTVMMRNVPDTKMNTDFSDTTPNILGSSIIFVNTGAVTKHVSYGSGNITGDAGQPGFETVATPIRSLIVIGGDIFIDEAILPATEGSSRVLIALKNEAGVGGNVYLKGGVTKIKASIIAEGSVLSGYFPSASSTGANLYNTTASGLFALPGAQLYIKGSVISHNTIGGAYGKTSGYVCPYIEPNCTSSKAIKYDFNYFRDFQKTDSGAVLFRGYDNDTYDDYSIIIEYDPNLIADPPPGIAEIK